MDEGETGFSGKEEVCGKESVILCYLRTEKRNGNEKYDTGCHVPLWDLGLFCSLSLIQLQLSVQSSLWKYIEFLSVIWYLARATLVSLSTALPSKACFVLERSREGAPTLHGVVRSWHAIPCHLLLQSKQVPQGKPYELTHHPMTPMASIESYELGIFMWFDIPETLSISGTNRRRRFEVEILLPPHCPRIVVHWDFRLTSVRVFRPTLGFGSTDDILFISASRRDRKSDDMSLVSSQALRTRSSRY